MSTKFNICKNYMQKYPSSIAKADQEKPRMFVETCIRCQSTSLSQNLVSDLTNCIYLYIKMKFTNLNNG